MMSRKYMCTIHAYNTKRDYLERGNDVHQKAQNFFLILYKYISATKNRNLGNFLHCRTKIFLFLFLHTKINERNHPLPKSRREKYCTFWRLISEKKTEKQRMQWSTLIWQVLQVSIVLEASYMYMRVWAGLLLGRLRGAYSKDVRLPPW